MTALTSQTLQGGRLGMNDDVGVAYAKGRSLWVGMNDALGVTKALANRLPFLSCARFMFVFPVIY